MGASTISHIADQRLSRANDDDGEATLPGCCEAPGVGRTAWRGGSTGRRCVRSARPNARQSRPAVESS